MIIQTQAGPSFLLNNWYVMIRIIEELSAIVGLILYITNVSCHKLQWILSCYDLYVIQTNWCWNYGRLCIIYLGLEYATVSLWFQHKITLYNQLHPENMIQFTTLFKLLVRYFLPTAKWPHNGDVTKLQLIIIWY